jgi:hypothetical protein
MSDTSLKNLWRICIKKYLQFISTHTYIYIYIYIKTLLFDDYLNKYIKHMVLHNVEDDDTKTILDARLFQNSLTS